MFPRIQCISLDAHFPGVGAVPTTAVLVAATATVGVVIAKLKCINTISFHPHNVFQNLVNGVGKRLSNLSSNKKAFNAAVTYYNEALAASGFKESINYMSDSCDRRRKHRINTIRFSSFLLNTITHIRRCSLN